MGQLHPSGLCRRMEEESPGTGPKALWAREKSFPGLRSEFGYSHITRCCFHRFYRLVHRETLLNVRRIED